MNLAKQKNKKDNSTMSSSISIVIAAHVLDSKLRRCLNAVSSYSTENLAEVVLVLDGIDRANQFFDNVDSTDLKVISLDKSYGPAYARNIGASQARADVLFFLDSDVEISADTLSKVADHFLSPNAPDALIGSYDDEPAETSVVSRFRNLLHYYTHQQASDEASTFWGACGAIRKDAFVQIGGFNTDFSKPSVEDIELGYRLKLKGYRIKLNKELQVKHLKKWSFKSMVETDVFLRAKPWTELLFQYKQWGKRDLNVKNSERAAVFILCMLLISLGFGLFYTYALFLSLAFFLILLVIKRNVYFFLSKHFRQQLPIVIILHWTYLISGAFGLVLGLVSHFFKGQKQNSVSFADSSLIYDTTKPKV